MDDVSDDDDDWYDTQADIDREANDDEDDASKLPNFESYDEFWAFTQEKNAQAVRDAGGDPAKTPGADNLPKGRHGETLKKGVPLSGKVRCWACDAVTTTQLECALCLEIMKERAVKAAYDNWERAFFCSHLCYREHYPNTRRGTGRPSPSRPRRTGPSTGSRAPKDAARSGTQRRSNDTTSRSASRTTKQCGLIITTYSNSLIHTRLL